MNNNIFIYLCGGAAFIVGLLIFLRLRGVLNSIVDDTLKREINGKRYWSPTKLTMASAWFIVVWSYIYDLIKNGFNETAFMVLTGVALGAKVTDAWSKKMNPLVQPKKNEDTTISNTDNPS